MSESHGGCGSGVDTLVTVLPGGSVTNYVWVSGNILIYSQILVCRSPLAEEVGLKPALENFTMHNAQSAGAAQCGGTHTAFDCAT